MQTSRAETALKALFTAYSLVLLLKILSPQWSAYLSLDNRYWPIWDPAYHIRNGITLYQQFMNFDLLSFIYELLSMKFWLPTHSLLLMAVSFFAPYQFEPMVYLNYLLMAGSLTAAALLLGRSWVERSFFLLLSVLTLALLGRSDVFVTHLNSVMQEALSFALTLLFGVFTLRFLRDRLYKDFKFSGISLLLIFLCKIHYGLLLLPTWLILFWKQAFPGQPITGFLRRLWFFFKRKLQYRYAQALLALFVLLIGVLALRLSGWTELNLGLFKISMNRYHNMMWLLLFIPLLLWTVECLKGRNDIYRSFNDYARFTHNFLLMPYAWYYLFPFRHKVWAFLYNVKFSTKAGQLDLQSKALYYPQHLLEDFFNISEPSPLLCWILLALLSAFAIHALINSFSKEAFKERSFLTLQILSFFLILSFLNSNPMSRLLFSLLPFLLLSVMLAGTLLSQKIEKLSLRTQKITIWLALIASLVGVRSSISLADNDALRKAAGKHYLRQNHLKLQAVFDCINPREPAIIYGLKEASVPLINLRMLMQMDASSRLKQQRVFSNGFGLRGNHNPVDFIRQQRLSLGTAQFVFFKGKEFRRHIEGLSKEITSADSAIQVLDDNAHYVFLADPSKLKTGCPLRN